MPDTGEPTYEELRAANSVLRAQVVVLSDQHAVLADQVAELEKKLSKDSSSSSLPPSSDRFTSGTFLAIPRGCNVRPGCGWF